MLTQWQVAWDTRGLLAQLADLPVHSRIYDVEDCEQEKEANCDRLAWRDAGHEFLKHRGSSYLLPMVWNGMKRPE